MLAARRAVRCAVCLALLSASWAAQAQCPLLQNAQGSATSGPVEARWATEPAPVQVGEPFVMLLALCPASVKLVGVDATMPEHRHGMNYKPSFRPTGEGQWRVEGMVWHMAGRWELRLDTQLDGVPHRLTPSVMLK